MMHQPGRAGQGKAWQGKAWQGSPAAAGDFNHMNDF
jgi:hypothetical protein